MKNFSQFAYNCTDIKWPGTWCSPIFIAASECFLPSLSLSACGRSSQLASDPFLQFQKFGPKIWQTRPLPLSISDHNNMQDHSDTRPDAPKLWVSRHFLIWDHERIQNLEKILNLAELFVWWIDLCPDTRWNVFVLWLIQAPTRYN